MISMVSTRKRSPKSHEKAMFPKVGNGTELEFIQLNPIDVLLDAKKERNPIDLKYGLRNI
jgi:hypothetical protein